MRFPLPCSLIVLALTLLLSACGGGGGGSSDPEPPVSTDPTIYRGKAILGPITNASVELYALGDYESLICTTTTSDSDQLDQAGIIEIEESCLTGNGMYLLVVSGGEDIDANDDGQVDSNPVPVSGKLHAILSREQITAGNWKVNLLTELSYNRAKTLLSLNTPNQQLLDELNRLAGTLLNKDLNNDGDIDATDVSLWNPTTDVTYSFLSASNISLLNEAIHNDTLSALVISEALKLNRPIQLTPEFQIKSLGASKENLYLCTDSGIRIYKNTEMLSSNSPTPFLTTNPESDGLNATFCLITEDGFLYTNSPADDTFTILDTNQQDSISTTDFELGITLTAPFGLRILDDYLFITFLDRTDFSIIETIHIYDITNRETPTKINTIESIENITAFDISGSNIFLTTVDGDLIVVDFSNQQNTSITDAINLSGYTGSTIATTANRAYISAFDEEDLSIVLVVDISDTDNVSIIGEPFRAPYTDREFKTSFFRKGNQILCQAREPRPTPFLSIPFSKPCTMDLADADKPLISILTTDNDNILATVYLDQHYINLLDDNSLELRNIEASVTKPLAFLYTADRLEHTVIKGELASLAINEAGWTLLNIADTNSIQTVYSTNDFTVDLEGSHGVSRSLFLNDTTIAIAISAKHEAYLWVYDIQDPTQPSRIATHYFNDKIKDMLLFNSILFIANNNEGLTVLDVSDPASPSLLTTFQTDPAFEASDLALNGEFLILSNENGDTKVIDISSPHAPALVSNYESPNPSNGLIPGDITTLGNSIAAVIQVKIVDFFAGKTAGFLEIVDFSVPASPSALSSIELSGDSAYAAVVADDIYTADRAGNIDIVNLLDPSVPIRVDQIISENTVSNISVENDLIFQSTNTGLFIYKDPINIDLP